MATCLAKSCSFGLPCVHFLKCCHFIYLVIAVILFNSYFPSGFEGRIWDLIVSVPDHCLSSYF